jgi:hypothetical protein
VSVDWDCDKGKTSKGHAMPTLDTLRLVPDVVYFRARLSGLLIELSKRAWQDLKDSCS